VKTKEQRTANRRLAKVAVQCSADTFVVNQTLVLRINICAQNRHLRQAPNRYSQWFSDVFSNYGLLKTWAILSIFVDILIL